MATKSTTPAVTETRKAEQKITWGELPSFPEDYKHPDSYYIRIPKEQAYSLADYAKDHKEAK